MTIPRPESFGDCIKLCQSDQFRECGRVVSSGKILLKAMLLPFNISSYLVWLRLSSVNRFWSIPFRVLHKTAGFFRNIQISHKTKIGFGFYIGHGICIVINLGTIIGNNVNIGQFLNIGTSRKTPAIIGNNVFIGSMCCIVEDVSIGDNAVIGAGAVVSKSIQAGTTAVGSPAKPINNNPPDYILNPCDKSWGYE